MNSLEQVRSALVAKLGDEEQARAGQRPDHLRTGVNLSVIDPRRSKDPGSIGKVLTALRDMGFD